MMKKTVSYLVIITLLVSLFSQITLFAKPKTKLNHKRITLTVGQTKKLKVKNKPKKAKVKWYSKNKKIVKVSKKGKVVAQKVGKATVVAKVNKKKYKCKINVKKKMAKSAVATTADGIVPIVEEETTSKTEEEVETTRPIVTENDIVANLSKRMNVVCHRGYNSEAPENSLAAFRLAKEKGYDTVEADVKYTKDGTMVMVHDPTINRVARNADGTPISEPVRITQITYEQALSYDFGIYKSEKYTGTKILKVEDFFNLCKEIDLKVYLHLFMGSETHVRALVDMVNDYGLKDSITWYSFTPKLVRYVRDYDHSARLGVATAKGITSDLISEMKELNKYGNPVFVNSATYKKEEIELCKREKIPLEVWFLNSLDKINALDSYISGVTVDYIR